MYSKKFFLILFVSSVTLFADLTETRQNPIVITDIPSDVKTIAPAPDIMTYEQALTKVNDEYRQRLQKFWPDPRLSSKMRWVSYTPDSRSRTIVDFSEAKIILETFSPNRQKAYNDLRNTLRRAITIDTKRAYENDPLQKQIVRIRRPVVMADQLLKGEAVLRDVLFNTAPTDKEIDAYIATVLPQEAITPEYDESTSRLRHYQVHIPLPQDITQRLSLIHRDTVVKASRTFKLPAPLIFAIIHSESRYNPFSTSYLTAYGLMSIRPDTMGRETLLLVHGNDNIPTAQYLYDSRNNIELGTAFLHLLYYRHLKDITDKNSRLYSTIVAYEEGIEELTQAFSQDSDLDAAIAKINTLGSKEVYRHLQENLRHDSTKRFLLEVIKNMIDYYKVYGKDGRS